jgi:uncharacterized protein YciI
MFIIDLKYIVAPELVVAHMDAHGEHLQKYYDEKIFLAWGKKEPWTGGIIFALANSREDIDRINKEDPFYVHNIAEFTVVELSLVKYHPDLELLSSAR